MLARIYFSFRSTALPIVDISLNKLRLENVLIFLNSQVNGSSKETRAKTKMDDCHLPISNISLQFVKIIL